MAKLKQILLSLLFAIVISAIQIFFAFYYSQKVLWQTQLLLYFVGPGPIFGYENGQPLYEGTPVHELAAYTGIILGIVVYWFIGYFIIRRWYNNRLVSDAESNQVL